VIHEIKTWPEPFQALREGRNDRDYAVGDVLILREFDPESGVYRPRSCRREVTYLIRGSDLGIPVGILGQHLRFYFS
jgi:hypothetical protein